MMTLMERIDAFTERHGMSPYAFGHKAIGDKHLVSQLRAGRDLRMSTVKRIEQFMADRDAGASFDQTPN
jgi:hypothetical protein